MLASAEASKSQLAFVLKVTLDHFDVKYQCCASSIMCLAEGVPGDWRFGVAPSLLGDESVVQNILQHTTLTSYTTLTTMHAVSFNSDRHPHRMRPSVGSSTDFRNAHRRHMDGLPTEARSLVPGTKLRNFGTPLSSLASSRCGNLRMREFLELLSWSWDSEKFSWGAPI